MWMRFPATIAMALALAAAAGCANFGTKFAQSEDLLDFLAALSGREENDVYPVERVSAGSGQIMTGHVRRDPRGVYVFGSIGRSFGFSPPNPANAHVDVYVLDARKRVLSGTATAFSTWENSPVIPAQRIGRYSISLTSTPIGASAIRVVFHPVPLSECKFGRRL